MNMLDFPLVRDLLSDPEVVKRAPGWPVVQAETRRQDILRFLAARFGAVPPEIEAMLKSTVEPTRLDELIDWAARCPDLEAFRARLTA
jgi:hypothetical protein